MANQNKHPLNNIDIRNCVIQAIRNAKSTKSLKKYLEQLIDSPPLINDILFDQLGSVKLYDAVVQERPPKFQVHIDPEPFQGIEQIDLHGMKCGPAIDALLDKLVQARSRCQKAHDDFEEEHEVQLLIVTGRGNHSERHKAMIKPEVLRVLHGNNINFTSEVDGHYWVVIDRQTAIM